MTGAESDHEPWHGTLGGYTNHHCRGDQCVAAHREHYTRVRADRIATTPWDEIPHGTYNGYNNYKCRCIPCTGAMALTRKTWPSVINRDRRKNQPNSRGRSSGMAIYVDDYRVEARVGGLHSRWSHLIADTPEELHAFAARIGLRYQWFQDPTVNGKPKAEPGTRLAENWHYDVTDSKRKEAIRLGAKQVSWRRLPEIIEARWQAKQNGTAPVAGMPL